MMLVKEEPVVITNPRRRVCRGRALASVGVVLLLLWILLVGPLPIFVVASSGAASGTSVTRRQSRAGNSSFFFGIGGEPDERNEQEQPAETLILASTTTARTKAKSDRERGWPPFYPRKFGSAATTTATGTTTEKKKPKAKATGGKKPKNDAAASASADFAATNPSTTMMEADPEAKEGPTEAPKETKDWAPKGMVPGGTTIIPIEEGPVRSSSSRRDSTALEQSNRTAAAAPAPAGGEAREGEEKEPVAATPLAVAEKARTTITFFRRRRTGFVTDETLTPDGTAKADNNNETTTTARLPALLDASEITTSVTSSDIRAMDGSNATEPQKDAAGTMHSNETTTAGAATATNATPGMGQQDSQQPQQQPPPQSGLILLGTPPPSSASLPYRIYQRGRGGPPGGRGAGGGGITGILLPPGTAGFDPSSPPPQQQSPGRVPPSTQSTTVALLSELAASALGTVARVWLLRNVASWLAGEEETIKPTQHFVWESLNDRHSRDASALSTALSSPPPGVSAARWKRQMRNRARQLGRSREQHARRRKKQQQGLIDASDSSFLEVEDDDATNLPLDSSLDLASAFRRTVVVVDVPSEGREGPDNEHLADVVTFLLTQHRRHAFGTNATTFRACELEVVLLVNSPGGSVASFGLAAAQVQRLTGEPGMKTTVCVDKYAASGGYMIASQANSLLAAPFASVGSVGVILEGLNFHEVARNWGVQPLVIKAGDSKNPLTTFGSVTKQDLEHQKDQLEKVHAAFKQLVLQGRPSLKDRLDQVANGNVFLGDEALDLELVDRVATSSQYLLERVQAGDRVLKLHRSSPSRFPRRVGSLSPLDILPHLRSRLERLVQAVRSQVEQHADFSSWIVQGATYLSLLHHLFTQYRRPR